MNEKNVKKLKEVLKELTEDLNTEVENFDYSDLKQKIRVIDSLTHTITLIEKTF